MFLAYLFCKCSLFLWQYDCLYHHLNINTNDNIYFCKLISHLKNWFTLCSWWQMYLAKNCQIEETSNLVSKVILSINNWMKNLSVYFLVVARWYHLSTVPKEWNRFSYVPNFWGWWDNNLTIIKNNEIRWVLKKFTAAVMSIEACSVIHNPDKQCFKLNHAYFVNLLKITGVETWIVQGSRRFHNAKFLSLREWNLTFI